MNETIQQLIVLVAVAAAVAYLLLRGRGKRGGKGGCNCGPRKSPLK